MKRRNFLSTLPGLALLSSCGQKDTGPLKKLRFGHFPNVTHVQGLVAHNLSRKGKGWFESRLGVEIEWFTYNAGPSAMEAIFARALDVTYVGPSPALNAYAKSQGTDIRVLAGAVNGGNSLVVRPDAGITKPEDFRGKKIASPQLGNTQDVQLRAWLAEHGIKVTQTGGDAYVVPTQNADQLALFQTKEIDAVWTVEPWVTRLELEAGGKIFLEDKDTNITLLVGSAAFVKDHADIAKKLLDAHKELTQWIKDHAAEAYELIKAELTEITKAAPKDELLKKALSRVVLTNDISHDSLERMVASAKKVGFLTDIPDLGNLLPKL
jgi:NitT/TauT family transport system substrate-binding protein